MVSNLTQPARLSASSLKSRLLAILGASVFGFTLLATPSVAQTFSATGMITDWNGYTQTLRGTTTANISLANSARNDANLLAFRYNNTWYSTKANDSILTANGVSFVASRFHAVNVVSMPGAPTSVTKAIWGADKDGVANGFDASAPFVRPDLAGLVPLLTDGERGMNITTGIANVTTGNIVFDVLSLASAKVGDGEPDLLITQVAQPSQSFDSYRFLDVNDNLIGVAVSINLDTMTSIGAYTADFYEAHLNPMTLLPAVDRTNSPRDIRLWAADLSQFGITAANAPLVAKLRITLSGTSDLAFIATATPSIQLNQQGAPPLPVELLSFEARAVEGNQVSINWTTTAEVNAHYFDIQRSLDGVNFQAFDRVPSQGCGGNVCYYKAIDQAPQKNENGTSASTNFYRLRQVDLDGAESFSRVVGVSKGATQTKVSIYPNLVETNFMVQGIYEQSSYTLTDAVGKTVKSGLVNPNEVLSIDDITSGIYWFSVPNAAPVKIVIQ